MSSNTAATADSAQQNNFNPSWMRSAFHGGGITSSPRASTNEDDADYPVCAPVFVKNRYGREDLIALLGQPDNGPPDGLPECPFYVPSPQHPIVCYPLSELEQRLQQNVNSSKAMSQLSHAERASVASGAAYSGGSPNGTVPGGSASKAAPPTAGGGWTPVKSSTWSRGASNPNSASSLTRGSSRPYVPARGGARPSDPSSVGGHGEDATTPFGQRFAYPSTRGGRGAVPPTRGASVTANSFNSRAQGLYDPRDPKDRPRNRLRSTSEEGDAAPSESTNGGGSGTAGTPRQPAWGNREASAASGTANPWNKDGSWNISRENSHSSANGAWKSDSAGAMPEWMDDDDSKIVANNESGVPVTAGSFDEKGRFREEPTGIKVEDRTAAPAPANPWMPSRDANHQMQQQHMSQQPQSQSMSSNIPSQQQAGPYNVAYTGMPVAPAPKPVVVRPPPTFYYLDPNNTERGSFSKDQMDAWLSSGYFKDTLQVRRNYDTNFKTLGELKKLNGELTPFDYRDEVVTPAAPPQQQFPPSSFANMFASTVSGVWNDGINGGLGNIGNQYGQQQMYDPIAIERKRIEEQQRQLLEEQLKVREHELLVQVQRHAEEQARMMLEKELALKKREEEIARIDADRMAREMEQMKLSEKVRQLEAEKHAREEAERRSAEDARKRAEDAKKVDSEKRKREKEAEEAKKREEAERRKRSEEAAEDHKRKLQQKAEQDAAKIREAQSAKEAARRAEEERREAASAAKAAERMFDIEEAWEQPPKKSAGAGGDADDGWTTQTTKKAAAPKVAPWVGSSSAPREKTLKEIQEEEERQLEAERKEQSRIRKEQEATAASVRQMSAGSWSNASQRISWNQPALSSSGKAAVAWGGAALEQNKPVAPSPFWDGPSLAAANRTAPAAAKKAAAPAKAAVSKQVVPPPKKQEKRPADAFITWVVSRLKELNSTVEADVLATFLESVENPNEVEDYVEGYLGSSKASKEFVKEFLSKRCEMRKRKGTTQKDDLSSASVAPAAAAAGNGAGGQGKKKKGGKGTKMDGSLLGFRPAGDPNRLNQGEIETIPPVSSGRR